MQITVCVAMKGKIVYGLTAVAIAFLTLSGMIVFPPAIDSGFENDQSCGDGVEWDLKDGVLSITYTGSGSGRMNDYRSHAMPWDNKIESISAVVIGEGVTRIGEMAFSGAVNLSSATIASTVDSIGEFAFENCQSLNEVKLPSNLEIIEYSAFNSCGLESIDIPDGTVNIGEWAFFNSQKLANVHIGSGVTEIDVGAFEGCTSLKAFDVSPDNPVFVTEQGVLCMPGTGTVLECPTGWDRGLFTVPDGYLTIAENAFIGCEKVTSVDLGNTVTTVSNGAFMNCSGIESIKWSPVLTSIGNIAFQFNTSLKDVVIPSTVETMGSGAFSGCESMEHAVVPGSISRIEQATFKSTGLKNIVMEEGIEYVGDYAFAGCQSLESISFPDSLETVHYNVFDDSTNLRSVSFGTGLTSLNVNAFTNTPSMMEVSIAEDNPSYCSVDGVVYDEAMTELIFYPPMKPGNAFTVPLTVRTIRNLGFTNNINLQTITLPEGLERICSGSFLGCRSLISLSIPDTVTTIERNSFVDCRHLISFEIPSLLTTIPSDMLSYCVSLKSITIPDSVVSIEFSAFEDCESLSWIQMGTSVEKIGKNAFTAKFYADGKEIEATPENLAGKTWVGSGTDECFYLLGSGFTVIFDAGDGTSTSDIMTTVNGKLPSLPIATLDGKEFEGWLTDAGETVTTDTILTAETTLKAKWADKEQSSGPDMVIIAAVVGAVIAVIIVASIAYKRRL